MMPTSRCVYYLFLTLVLRSSATVLRNDLAEKSLRVRVRRQDGYVYDKPSISFELPSQSTTESTQAATVDRTLTQQMFYAYPAPAGGGTINIGNTAGTTIGTTASSAPTAGAGGYNYRSSTTANAGYSYGTGAPTGVQTNTASQVTNTASQTSVTGSKSATSTGSAQAGSGYGYNAPSPTLSPSLQGSSEVSTSAPKYLPPTTGGGTGSSGSGGTVNIGSVSVTSGTGQVTTGSNTATQTGYTSVATPSESYLPPLSTTNTVSSGQPVTSSGTQTKSGGSVSVPSVDYLPPKSSPSTTPSTIPSTTSQPAPPAGGYIPPSNTGSNSGTISTSASRYLPPGFF